MTMRVFAKYCQKGISSGSRHCSSSSSQNTVRQVKTVEEVHELLPGLVGTFLYYGLETVTFKLAFFYLGYNIALIRSPYEKHAAELKDLMLKKQLLDVKCEMLEKIEDSISASSSRDKVVHGKF